MNCFAITGTELSVSDKNQRVETIPETAGSKLITKDTPVEPIHCTSAKSSMARGSITWSVEDWDGSYGAIADDVSMTGDGNRIYVAWNLNDERISGFDGAGTGTPLWEYDVREGVTYNVSGSLLVRVSEGGNLLVATVSARVPAGDIIRESLLYRLDLGTGADYWPPIKMPATVSAPDDTEHITHLEISADGSIIAVATRGIRSDPIYEPFFIHLYRPDGTIMDTIEIPDTTGDLLYLNDLKIIDNGTLMVADFRASVAPKQIVKVWDLTTFTQVQEFGYPEEGPQCSLGLSGDGGYLAIGNLRGIMRVFKLNTLMKKYTELWSYSIPPDYYYGWIKALDISKDGTILAMGSYQPNSTASHGYVYVFDIGSGASYIYKSPDFGDLVEDVAVSANGDIAVGVGWGAFSPPAGQYDLIVYNTATDEEVYHMADTFPGSLMTCEIDNFGTRVATGGKRVHARAFGSGGWAYSIELDTKIPVHSSPGLLLLVFTLTLVSGIVSIYRIKL